MSRLLTPVTTVCQFGVILWCLYEEDGAMKGDFVCDFTGSQLTIVRHEQ